MIWTVIVQHWSVFCFALRTLTESRLGWAHESPPLGRVLVSCSSSCSPVGHQSHQQPLLKNQLQHPVSRLSASPGWQSGFIMVLPNSLCNVFVFLFSITPEWPKRGFLLSATYPFLSGWSIPSWMCDGTTPSYISPACPPYYSNHRPVTPLWASPLGLEYMLPHSPYKW